MAFYDFPAQHCAEHTYAATRLNPPSLPSDTGPSVPAGTVCLEDGMLQHDVQTWDNVRKRTGADYADSPTWPR